jgi:hypothetical protein
MPQEPSAGPPSLPPPPNYGPPLTLATAARVMGA